MTAAIRRAVRRLHRDESGSSLPESLVAVMVTGACMTVIAGAVIGISAFSGAISESASSTNAAVLADANWRSNAQRAIAVKSTGPDNVTFITYRSDGVCEEILWTVKPSGPAATVTTKLTQFTGSPGSSGCSGTISGTGTSVTLATVSSDTAVSFTNPGGRTMTATATGPVIAAGTKPATVPATRWNSAAVGSVTLTGTVNPDSKNEAAFRSVQTTPQISPLTGSAVGGSTLNAP